MSHIIVHVPHASTYIPPQYLSFYTTTDLQGELLRMTDLYCDELFSSQNMMLRARVSRLFCDMERLPDDDQEEMAKVGMGKLYRSCSDLSELRCITPQAEKEIISGYYIPYHEKLLHYVRTAMKKYGRCLIIDGHSFPARPLPYEPDQNPDRPDICIGTDDRRTPEYLARSVTDFFEKKGYCIRVNAPYSGCMYPLEEKDNPGLASVMIELNRGLYMNEKGEKTRGFCQLKRNLGEFMNYAESLMF